MTYLKLELDMMLIFVYDNIGQDWTSLDKFGQDWTSLDQFGYVEITSMSMLWDIFKCGAIQSLTNLVWVDHT